MSRFAPSAQRSTRLFLQDQKAREALRSGDLDDATVVVADFEVEKVEADFETRDCEDCAKRDEPASDCKVCEGSGTFESKTVKAADGEEVRRRRYTLSNAKRDLYHDSISVEGWELDAFHAATGYGPVLYSHSHHIPPIGRGTAKKLKTKLVGAAEFLPESVDDFVDQVVRMIDFGALKACSVGFQPERGEYEWNEDEGGYDFRKQRLLEFSVCSVGAHPEALIAATAAGVDKSFLAELARREMEYLEGEGLWVPRQKLAAVASSLGYGKGGVALFSLNADEIRETVHERSGVSLSDMPEDELRALGEEVSEEVERRDSEKGEVFPVKIEVTGTEKLEELVARLEKALDPEPFLENEEEPVLRLLPDPDPEPEPKIAVNRDDLEGVIRRATAEAMEEIKRSVTKATGRVIL